MDLTQINLTKREIEVLALCAKGYSNLEIAERLNISFHTAKVHVSNILEKLNVPSRLIAVLIATKNGLI